MTGEICRFGLIVTGKGEEESLPELFRVFMAKAYCVFSVIRRVGQRNPVTAPARLVRMVGKGQRIPTKDEEEIGLPVLLFLRRYPGSYAMLVDDLEGARRDVAAEVFRGTGVTERSADDDELAHARGSAFPCKYA